MYLTSLYKDHVMHGRDNETHEPLDKGGRKGWSLKLKRANIFFGTDLLIAIW